MSPALRRIAKWTARLFLLLLAVGLVYVAILVYPSPLFAHRQTFDTYRVFSDEPISGDVESWIDELDERIRGMEHAPPEASQRIYLCEPRKYAFFASLARMNPESLAIGLSVANETFVNLERVQLFADRNQGVFRHTRFEGNMAEVVAHEIAHFNSVHALGYRTHLRQPLWKSEGWAEYQANLAMIRSDPEYDLRRRIDLLLDDRYWGVGGGVARSLWESQLLVEFLGEVKGLRLQDLSDDERTETSIREQMMGWYRSAANLADPMVVTLEAVRVSDDDGSRPAAIDHRGISEWVAFANEVYASAGIRFIWDASAELEQIHSTTLNNAAFGDEAHWPEVKRLGNEVAARVQPAVPLLFRHGPEPHPTGQSWAGGDYDFVVMSGFEPSTVCGEQNIGLLAHELGHFLGLGHTFKQEFASIEEATSRFRDEGAEAFDGDGIADTLPDPFVRQDHLQCKPVHALQLDDVLVHLPRDNVMSYWLWPTKTLTFTQQSLVRQAAKLRVERPVNRPGGNALELEDLEPLGLSGCEFYLQPMDSWGGERWSAGMQRFCGAVPGDSFTLGFDVVASGDYDLVLYATRAPDFGTYRVSADGEAIGPAIDGYAPLVVPSGPIALGRRSLSPGRHRLTFEVSGRNTLSRGTFVGVDSLELMPVQN